MFHCRHFQPDVLYMEGTDLPGSVCMHNVEILSQPINFTITPESAMNGQFGGFSAGSGMRNGSSPNASLNLADV